MMMSPGDCSIASGNNSVEFDVTPMGSGTEHSDLQDVGQPQQQHHQLQQDAAKKKRGSMGPTKDIFKGLMTPIKFAKKFGDQLSLSAHGNKNKIALHDLEASFPDLDLQQQQQQQQDKQGADDALRTNCNGNNHHNSSSSSNGKTGDSHKKERHARPRHRDMSCPPPTTKSRSHSVTGITSSRRRGPPRRQMSVNELLDQQQQKEKQQDHKSSRISSSASTGTYPSSRSQQDGDRSHKHKSSSGREKKSSRRGRRRDGSGDADDKDKDKDKDKSSRKHKKRDKERKERKTSETDDDQHKERRTPRRTSSGYSVRSEDGTERASRRGRSSSVAAPSSGRRSSSRSSTSKPKPPERSRSSSRVRPGMLKQLSARAAFLRGDDIDTIEPTVSRDSTGTEGTSLSRNTTSMDASETTTKTTWEGRRMSLGLHRTESSRDVIAKAAAQLMHSTSRRNIMEDMTPAERGVVRSTSRRNLSLTKNISDETPHDQSNVTTTPGRKSFIERQTERRSSLTINTPVSDDDADNDLEEKYKTDPLVIINNTPQTEREESRGLQLVSPKHEPRIVTPSSVPPQKTSSTTANATSNKSTTHKTDNISSGTDSTRRETTSSCEDPLESDEKLMETNEIMEEADDIIDSDHEEPPARLSPQDAAALARARAMEILSASTASSSGGGSVLSTESYEASYSNRSTSRSARQYQHDLAAIAALRGSSGSTSRRTASHKHGSQDKNGNQDKHHHRSHDKHHKHHSHNKIAGGSPSQQNSGSRSGRRGRAPKPLLPPDGPGESMWTCSCGEGNKNRFSFCGICGGPKPMPKVETKWECVTCGRPDNEPRFKFCVGCGTPR